MKNLKDRHLLDPYGDLVNRWGNLQIKCVEDAEGYKFFYVQGTSFSQVPKTFIWVDNYDFNPFPFESMRDCLALTAVEIYLRFDAETIITFPVCDVESSPFQTVLLTSKRSQNVNLQSVFIDAGKLGNEDLFIELLEHDEPQLRADYGSRFDDAMAKAYRMLPRH